MGVSSEGSAIFVHFCPMLLMGVEWFCSQFCSHFMVVFGGIGSLLRLSDCLLVSGSDECFPMASHDSAHLSLLQRLPCLISQDLVRSLLVIEGKIQLEIANS